jgi:hypothetical protein
VPTLTNLTQEGLSIGYNPDWQIADATCTPAAWASFVQVADFQPGLPTGSLTLQPGSGVTIPANFAAQLQGDDGLGFDFSDQ